METIDDKRQERATRASGTGGSGRPGAARGQLPDEALRLLGRVVERGSRVAGRLALEGARVARLGRNVLLDLRFGKFLGGIRATRFAHLGAHETANSDYAWMDEVFRGRIRPDDVLVDVGCGRGRVINWWLASGAGRRIFGLELDPEVADDVRRRLGKQTKVTILTGDAVENLPADGTLFYLYNPFGPLVLARFRDRLLALCEGKDEARRKDLRIVYVNPEHLPVFDHPAFVVEAQGHTAGRDGGRAGGVRQPGVGYAIIRLRG
jgi:hypothetical protein